MNRFVNHCSQVAIGIVVLLVASCSGSTVDLSNVSANTNAKIQNVATGTTRVYRLGSGDKLLVTVEGVKDHSGQFDVNGGGFVSMPFVGNVKAAGLTVPEFTVSVTKALKAYVRNPQVRVTVMNYRPFYIQGEVKQGGQYEYRDGLDVRRAVAIAGGYTYRAVKGYAYIQRANETKERKFPLNRPVPVQPGDNIRIPERFF